MLVVVAVLGYGYGCVGCGLIFFFFFLAVGCGGHIEVVLVGGCSWPAVVVKCGDDRLWVFFNVLFYCSRNIILL